MKSSHYLYIFKARNKLLNMQGRNTEQFLYYDYKYMEKTGKLKRKLLSGKPHLINHFQG